MASPLPNRTRKSLWIGGVVLLAVLILGGWALIETARRIGSDFENKNLLSVASIAAASFEPDAVRSLKGSKEDISSLAFTAVREKLKRIKKQIPEARFVYLMGKNERGVFFLADAEEPTSEDYSPPGEPYPEASPILHQVFSASQPILEPPYRDRWGEWVSSLAPILDPATGKVLAVLGLDVPANHWRQQIDRFRLVAGIVVALFSVLLGCWIFIQARSRRKNRNDEEKIRHLANYDTLTGLPNRAAFVERLRLVFAGARRKDTSFAVLYLDIDHFKDINDSFGHLNGDLFLQMIAERLAATIRETDILGRLSVARLGGDEFVILATEVTAPSDAAALAQRLVNAMAKPFMLSGKSVHVTVSIGISLYDHTSTEVNDLLVQADLALYRSKEAGRGQFHFHSSDMDTNVQERVAIGEELRSALKNGELELYYQPQVEIPSGKITGVEALLRWKHPTRGMVPPDKFIAIAEKNGVIVPLGAWVIQEACRQTECWRAEGLIVPRMGVNVSAVQFRNPTDLLTVIVNALTSFNLGSGELEVEMTESVLIEASKAQSDTLNRLRSLGVRIAVDDFGTGFSSLEYLRSYPINRIKIAQQFMRKIPANANDTAIVEATIALANALKVDIIAEGVETSEQLQFLSAAGCRDIQGYYFSRPVPAKAMAEFLRRGNFDVPLAEPEGAAVNGLSPGPVLPTVVISEPATPKHALILNNPTVMNR